VHELLLGLKLDPARFVVEGHGDAHPLINNDTPENRAINRRVEMTIEQGREPTPAPDQPIAALRTTALDGLGASAQNNASTSAPLSEPVRAP
jgi:hypothetical protein